VVIEAVYKISSTSFLSNLVDMELMDQDGRSFEVDSLVDRVALFNFIFTRCGGTCPMQTRVLAQVFQQLPADVRSQVRFVSISVDPTNDTPAQLQRFAKTMNADLDGWSFLTGDAEQIDRLLQRLHIFEESDQANNPQIHRTALWLVDQRGRMLQRYQGDPPDKDRLIREIAQVSHLIVR
jgi:cytochrome oxidase Cu insertion factor (SCO1/SenC/PrrC family)